MFNMGLKHILPAIMLILMVSSLLRCDDIDDKMQQLRSIERQIDNLQEKAQQAEKKKQKTQSDINSSLKIKNQIDWKLATLQRNEQIMQDSLMAVKERVQTSEEQIYDLKTMANNEFLRLFYMETQDKYVARETNDRYLLSMLVSSSVKGIRDLFDYHKDLVQTEEERQHEVLTILSSKTKESRKSQLYQTRIASLQEQASSLDKEKEQYDQQVNQLKKDASQLQSLINSLSAGTGRQAHNYQFSTRQIPWPVKGKVIRDFGEEAKGNNTSVLSNGIDIAVPEGTNVKSVDDGEVVFADRYGGQGMLIIIDHKNGFFSVYAYNSSLQVHKGDKVRKGQIIAKSGKTGSAIQPSLHFELRKDGRAVNPMNYLE